MMRWLKAPAAAKAHNAVRCTVRSSQAARCMSTESAELAFRRFGHYEAQVDPLHFAQPTPRPELLAAAEKADPATIAHLRQVYTSAIGAEFEHLESAEERAWWAKQLEEGAASFSLSVAQQRNAATLMLQADTFENFLAKKYVSLKRYSGEGTEALLPALDTIFGTAANAGVKDIVIGMAHRGRLALLVSMLGYKARKLFHKIQGNDDIPFGIQGVDDVSSHIAASIDKAYGLGSKTHSVHVSLLHNPSHLEAINPVAVGKTRAKQDQGSENALCLLVHGDSAVYGQGVVAETYGMSRIPPYNVGGTLHLITNNQLGFTADAKTSRSSTYASDVAKMVAAPVLHVNAESVKHFTLACKLAVDYRNTFKKDVVIDLIGYRKFGHNELDEPAFTQPLMYNAIRARKPFAHTYAQQLEEAGVFSAGQKEALLAKLNSHLEAEYQAAQKEFTVASGTTGAGDGQTGSGSHIVADGTSFGGKWRNMRQATADELAHSPDTGADLNTLRRVAKASVTVPGDFRPHDRLVRGHVTPRLAAVEPGQESKYTIDWATAEAMAFGSLLSEGHDVRMSGQDAQRGTFSHRHAAFTDQTSGSKYVPLNHISPEQRGKFHIYSSNLSEFGVLGFEYGYSWENPNPLVLWEAQFGDFANGAQIIIDQFLTGGESKWLRQSGMVMLLPHGYDGAGPEHSSARIERFLQLVNSQAVARGASCLVPGADNAFDKSLTESCNMLIANPTTPANYFHLLRRQIHRPFRKPMVVIAPKTLLRHPEALSKLTDFAPGTKFSPVLRDTSKSAPSDADVRRVVLCSGKLHIELEHARAAATDAKARSTAVLRVEELAPFPTETIVETLKSFSNASEVVWAQEEPANAGAWTWAEAHLCTALEAAGLPKLRYVGRPALPTPAVGLSKYNKVQQQYLLHAALH